MKKLIYEIKLESNKLSEKSDEEINIILQTIKKRKNKESEWDRQKKIKNKYLNRFSSR